MFDSFEFDYQKLPKYIFIAAIVIAIVLLNFFFIRDYISSNSETINDYALRDADMNPTREAAVAGLFYPADVYQLEKDVKGYLQMQAPSLTKRPHILVVPHAGYMHSAQVAAKAYQQLLPFGSEIKRVILVGPAHRVPVKGAALSSAAKFKTPLGEVPTDKNLTDFLAAKPGFVYNDRAHKDEHSLEVQLPFLQKVLKKFTILPILYGQMEAETLAADLAPLLKQNDTLLVISADLSHYLDSDTAKKVDSTTAQMVEQGLPLDEHQSCGAIGINTAMILAKKEGLCPRLLDMANSGDVSGETNSVVGYAAWVFAGKETPGQKLSPLEQEVENLDNFARHNKENLLKIVKLSLAEAVLGKHYTPSREEYPNVLFDKGAAFVTLTKNGELRGCIGSLLPNQAIALDIAKNTFAAANEDSRFAPLNEAELPQIKASISLLSSYEKIKFKSEEDLLSQIIPGTDGLVLIDGDRQGLFLSSVWKQIPQKQEFLNNLKIKAGLSPSYWSKNVKIFRFRTVEVSE